MENDSNNNNDQSHHHGHHQYGGEPLNEADQMAASVVAGLSSAGKHGRDNDGGDQHDAAGGGSALVKKTRVEQEPEAEFVVDEAERPEFLPLAAAEPAPAAVLPAIVLEEPESAIAAAVGGDTVLVSAAAVELGPYPFFYYVDHSTDMDDDPLTPLTAPGRVPNFPAKMHAILSRSDLHEIISWQPHGRSFKVHRPRLFEANVISTYFEHSKFSSFIRQANGWGFRRLTNTGPDRNSYYHPLFLAGLPFLCKTMKRPGVSKKLAADPDHEPDLYEIAVLHPLPVHPVVDDSILLQCTIQGGPKARMPIYSGSILHSKPLTDWYDLDRKPAATNSNSNTANATEAQQLLPHDQEALSSFQAALLGTTTTPPAAAASIMAPVTNSTTSTTTTPPLFPPMMPNNMMMPNMMPFLMPGMMPGNFMMPGGNFMMPGLSTAAAPLNFLGGTTTNANATATNNNNNNTKGLAALAMANQMAFGNAAAQFAAGFAAAAAMSAQMIQQQQQRVQPPPPPVVSVPPPAEQQSPPQSSNNVSSAAS
jgi:HSF-type DNA-binding